MKIINRPKIYMVYGNHGESPHQIEDYFEYLLGISKALDFDLNFSRDPVAGATNILIEYFDASFAHKVEKCARTKGTRFIVLATEFVTGETFNRFDSTPVSPLPKKKKSKVLKGLKIISNVVIPMIFSPPVRSFLIEFFPRPYFWAKEIYLKNINIPITSTYDNIAYWLKRFRNFEKIVKYCDSIWCVTPHQIPGYEKHFTEHKIELLPIASWSPDVANPWQGKLQRDIDFLFTGSITPYRKVLLDKLAARGYNVIIGTPIWPRHVRENFTARSKVCLHLKQSADWKYPSVMRYHYLLTSGSVVLAEKSFEPCMQEDFLHLASAENFVEACERLVKSNDISALGTKGSLDYYSGSASSRLEIERLFKDYITNGDRTPHELEPSLSTN